MILFVYLALVAGIMLISVSFLPSSKFVETQLKLPQEGYAIKKIRKHSLFFLVLPFSQRLLEKLGLDVKIKNKLDAAHIKLTPTEFFNIKLITVLSLLVLMPVILGKINQLLLITVLVFGYAIPDIWVSKKIAGRKYAIARFLPETVDLLALCVEAGLDFTTAAKWIIEKTPSNPMIEELAFVLEEIKWGKQRIQSLKDMSKRLNIPELSSFVQTLIQAERMGTPVAEAFANLSEDARLQRFHHGERLAIQAPIKILIPLIFCILPVIAIIIGGPIMLQFMQGDIFKRF